MATRKFTITLVTYIRFQLGSTDFLGLGEILVVSCFAEDISKKPNKYYQQSRLNESSTRFMQNTPSQSQVRKMRIYLHVGESSWI